ncbi:molybdopterin-guanine dinucleotide biosynthesis protein A [Lachnospiraceae bacterium TWA4]|nr:molybdopterin-guanine dinucleotide biosynthesis protein A [Lachnospiraceae bacterium TWA4]
MEVISAGILAGGKSSRMGENKARLKFGKDSFVEKIAKECSDFHEVMVSVDDRAKYSDLPYRLVEDDKKGYGPLEGIFQLLKASKTEYVLVVATDMPFINREVLNKLANLVTGEEDCVVLCVDGKIQPLCSIYSKKVLSVLEQMREKEIHRPRLLYKSTITKYVEISELDEDAIAVDNINTKEEYCRAMQQMKAKRGN